MRPTLGLFIAAVLAASTSSGVASAWWQFEYEAADSTIEYELATGAGSGTASILISQVWGTIASVQGWSLGMAYDTSLLTAIDLDPGSYIQTVKNGSLPDFFEATIHFNGIAIGCIYCITGCGSFSFEAAEEVAVITYATDPTALAGDTDGAAAALTFCTCVGAAPVSNVVFVGGISIPALYDDGVVTLEMLARYARGDGNGNGTIDVLGDAVTTLGVVFGGDPTECLDAHDANDDGAVDVADPVLLLGWGFAMGAPPPAPFPDCGSDPTPDSLPCTWIECP